MQVIPSDLVVYVGLVEHDVLCRGPFKVENTNELIESFNEATRKYGSLSEKEVSDYKLLLLDSSQKAVFSKYVKEEVFSIVKEKIEIPMHINLWD